MINYIRGHLLACRGIMLFISVLTLIVLGIFYTSADLPTCEPCYNLGVVNGNSKTYLLTCTNSTLLLRRFNEEENRVIDIPFQIGDFTFIFNLLLHHQYAENAPSPRFYYESAGRYSAKADAK